MLAARSLNKFMRYDHLYQDVLREVFLFSVLHAGVLYNPPFFGVKCTRVAGPRREFLLYAVSLACLASTPVSLCVLLMAFQTWALSQPPFFWSDVCSGRKLSPHNYYCVFNRIELVLVPHSAFAAWFLPQMGLLDFLNGFLVGMAAALSGEATETGMF